MTVKANRARNKRRRESKLERDAKAAELALRKSSVSAALAQIAERFLRRDSSRTDKP